MRRLPTLATLLALVVTGRGALGQEVKASCARDAEAAQRLRDEGRPLAARGKLLSCSRPACPAVIVAHCGRWLEEVNATIPTLVIKARAGAERADVTDVAVFLDDKKVEDTLDGQPLRVEPGEHALRYVRRGSPPLESRVLVVAGEKNRLLMVEFTRTTAPAAPPSPAAPPAAPPSSPAPEAERPSSGPRPLAWVFAGAAVLAGGSFAYFGATGKSDLDGLRATCAGHCDQGSVSAAWNKLVVADVSLGVGVVSLGLATWLFLSPRHASAVPRDEASSSGWVVAPSARGLDVGWRGTF